VTGVRDVTLRDAPARARPEIITEPSIATKVPATANPICFIEAVVGPIWLRLLLTGEGIHGFANDVAKLPTTGVRTPPMGEKPSSHAETRPIVLATDQAQTQSAAVQHRVEAIAPIGRSRLRCIAGAMPADNDDAPRVPTRAPCGVGGR
jgi:hypothetical protein